MASAPPGTGPGKDLVAQAEAGNPAAFDLAVRYAEADAATRNYELAAKWYDKAGKQGNAVAEYRLASIYEKGVGVERSQASRCK